MNKYYILFFFFFMNLFAIQAQNFFDSKSSSYQVFLEEKQLSPKDAEKAIEILQSYPWKINKEDKESSLEVYKSHWGRYRHYLHRYNIKIVNPQKEQVTLRFHFLGFNKDKSLITSAKGEPLGTLELIQDEDSRWKSLDTLTGIVFSYIDNGIKIVDGEKIQIEANYSFRNFFQITIPTTMSEEDSRIVLEIYNGAWNIKSDFFPGGIPRPTINVYTREIKLRAAKFATLYPNSEYQPSVENKKKLDSIISKAMKGNNGASKINYLSYTINYEYQDGLLHGDVIISDSLGTILQTINYQKGIPTLNTQYIDGVKGESFSLSSVYTNVNSYIIDSAYIEDIGLPFPFGYKIKGVNPKCFIATEPASEDMSCYVVSEGGNCDDDDSFKIVEQYSSEYLVKKEQAKK